MPKSAMMSKGKPDHPSLEQNWEFVADSVIQATRTVEFEDGLRMVVLLGGCWGP